MCRASLPTARSAGRPQAPAAPCAVSERQRRRRAATLLEYAQGQDELADGTARGEVRRFGNERYLRGYAARDPGGPLRVRLAHKLQSALRQDDFEVPGSSLARTRSSPRRPVSSGYAVAARSDSPRRAKAVARTLRKYMSAKLSSASASARRPSRTSTSARSRRPWASGALAPISA